MPFRKKATPRTELDPTDEIAAAEAEIRAKADRLERFLREEPERKRRELEEERQRLEEESAELGPLEELAERERERRFDEDLRSGRLRNRRRELAGSLTLLVLLITALILTALWVLKVFSAAN